MDWYALFVETGKEHWVQRSLQRVLCGVDFRCIVPIRRVPERRQGHICSVLRPLFPGYVLIKTSMNLDLYRKLNCINRVIRVLRSEAAPGEAWTRIPPEEMAPILRLIGDGEVVEYSRVFVQGSRVLVISGPLKGLEGIIRKVDKHKRRAKIALSLGSATHLVDVGIELLSSSAEAR